MALYTKSSLDLLREKINLVDVLSAHIPLKRAGASYKALCPFHQEKTPSFMVHAGDTHYHCFGCGAHGDAIAFLMGFLHMGFTESIEHLAERFGVALDKEEGASEKAGPSKAELKEALEKASRFYHFSLLHSEEGAEALHYLYGRGLDLSFIRQFEIGYAPKNREVFYKFMRTNHFSDEILERAGLILLTENGRRRDFFSDRITFPIRDAMGSVIGFSGRKFKEETFGGKYVNTPETPLFKKSQVLFGLSYSRRRIAKERRAIIVEGQIDSLRLIQSGFNLTVAGQGTAFGEGHVRELLNLGVTQVYLALDGDEAGLQASRKIGDLFQKKGVEVWVVNLPLGKDPDTVLQEGGSELFLKLLKESKDYLSFLVDHLSKSVQADSPSGKNEVAKTLVQQIQAWEEPVMVHESLRKVALLLSIPEELISTLQPGPVTVKRFERVPFSTINPDLILEADVLRWLFLAGTLNPWMVDLARQNLKASHFRLDVCRRLFELYLQAEEEKRPRDLIAFSVCLEKEEDQAIFAEILQRKVNLQKGKEALIEAIQKMLQRAWMEEREAIKAKIHSGRLSEEETLLLAKEFDELKKKAPQVIVGQACKMALLSEGHVES